MKQRIIPAGIYSTWVYETTIGIILHSLKLSLSEIGMSVAFITNRIETMLFEQVEFLILKK